MLNIKPGTRLSAIRGLFISLMVLTTGPVHGQPPPFVGEITGEASVVIFENMETHEFEYRYFLVDQASRSETEVFFQGGPPARFRTGNVVRLQGKPAAMGFNVHAMEVLEDLFTPTAESGDGPQEDAGAAAPLASAETRNVLTLLVDFNDAYVDGAGMNYGVSLQEAKDKMFNNTKSVAGLYWNASLETLTIPPDPDGDGIQDVFGPYQINDSYIGGDSSQCSPSSWVTQASDAWIAANPGKDISLYRHRSLIVPNYWDWGNRHCGWGGVAQLGCGSWCWAVSADPDSILHGVIIHELGHNFGLHHARTDTNNDGSTDSEYGDSSDMMGGSRSWMKFNAPHAEDKGWIDPVNFEIRTITPSVSAQNFDLIAMDEEVWDWPGLRAIKVERTTNTDYYLSYRLAAGEYNNVGSGYRNRLNIHYGYDGSMATYFVTTLSAGQTYNDPHNNLTITATGEMTITGAAGSTTVMGVEICQDACSSIAAPSNLTATAAGTDTIDLAWNDNSDNENGFRIEHSDNGSSWALLDTVGADGVVYTHGGLGTATTHYYRVQAYDSTDNSGYSNVAVETTDAIPPSASFTWTADYTEVTFTDTSADSDGSVVGWNWSFGDGNSSSAQNPVHTYAAGDDYTVGLTVTDNHGATSFVSELISVDDPPFADFYANGESTVGGTVSGNYVSTHVDDGIVETIMERESGGKPSKRHSWLEHQWTFSITAGAAATVYVNAWRSDSGEGDTFDFDWSTNGTTWNPGATVSATSDPGTPQSFGLPGGTGGTVYLRVTDFDQTQGNRTLDAVYVDALRIRVENATGEPPEAPPSGLGATALSFDQVELTWNDNSSNETGFKVYRRLDGVGDYQLVGQAGANSDGTAMYVDSFGLTGDTAYQYQVTAFNLVGETAPSAPVSVTTDAAPDIVLHTATGYKVKGQHTVDLGWSTSSVSDMDVVRNGSVVATVSGLNTHTDNIGAKGGASYVYKICETGSTTACSNEVTVVF